MIGKNPEEQNGNQKAAIQQHPKADHIVPAGMQKKPRQQSGNCKTHLKPA